MAGVIAFRVDASIQIGTGHVMRCLTLADALRANGLRCIFICRKHPGYLSDLICQHGHRLIELEPIYNELKIAPDTPHAFWLGADWLTDAEQTSKALGREVVDWLVVDHYSLDRRWEQILRRQVQKIMVIDDLADRSHDCDLLLDQNLGSQMEDYKGLLSPTAKILIGPQYALLRQEFSQWRYYSLERRLKPQLKNLLISMGGIDKDNATSQVLDALKFCRLAPDIRITIVMGSNAPWLPQVKRLAEGMPWHTQVFVDVDNMAQLMADSDLAIGAAGSTAWERCCLGLPVIQKVLAENQKKIAKILVRLNAAILLDDNVRLRDIFEQLNLGVLRKMSKSASSICEGQGVRLISSRLIGKEDSIC